MSTLIPNTFQCFNLYIDRALEHLTDSEVRILWYTTRHILGWQDKIKKRHGHISLTMFENGYITETGKHYGGCGLGRGAIITACSKLVEFKFLAKIGEPTEDGQEWELTTDDIQWTALEARTTGKKAKQKQQTKKASAALLEKLGGSSNDTTPPISFNDTMLGSFNDTTPHIVQRTESKPSSKPDTKPSTSSDDETSKPRAKRYYFEAVAKGVFEISEFKGLSPASLKRIGLLEKAAKSTVSSQFPDIGDEQGALLVSKYCAAETFKPNLQGQTKFEMGLMAYLEKNSAYIPNYLAQQTALPPASDESSEYVDPEIVKAAMMAIQEKWNGNDKRAVS